MIAELTAALGRHVSRETTARLSRYVELLLAENEQQNLIATSTIVEVWQRHIIDSAQLERFLPPDDCVDIGSGAGLPGLVLAILSDRPFTLVEPRRLRVGFLEQCVAELGLQNVTVVQGKAAQLQGRYAAITARAVAPVAQLFAAAHHLSRSETIWVLPKGRRGQIELAAAQSTWQGRFRLEPSITDREAVILVASHIAKRKGRG